MLNLKIFEPFTGECLYCFITPNQHDAFDNKMISELKVLVREKIGPFAQPDVIQHAPGEFYTKKR
jgi:acetyl-CoA synthetase